MYEAELVHRLNGEDAFCNIEPGNVFGERVVLDEHGHKVTSRQELHDQVEIRTVLEGVV